MEVEIWLNSVCLLLCMVMLKNMMKKIKGRSGKKQTILTGFKPTGNLHIGNYFGAMKPFLDTYEDYNSFFMVADYHAITTVRKSELLRKNILNLVRDFMAVGLDPEKSVIFRQSDNQDHTELAWILNCVVTVPFLMQSHAYKDSVNKGVEASAGLFTYPILQAADITLYNSDVVPVGEDRRQHLEYAREAVRKFNSSFGDWVLKEPKEKIIKSVGVVPGTDGEKMSKSYGNTIPLFATPAEIEKAVMSIVTDSAGDHPKNVYNIHRLIKDEKELVPIYDKHRGRYGDLKKILIADLEAFIAPFRDRRTAITDKQVMDIMAAGLVKAKQVSSPTLDKVRRAIGVTL